MKITNLLVDIQIEYTKFMIIRDYGQENADVGSVLNRFIL